MYIYPRHPKTPSEGVLGMFWGSKYLLSRYLDVIRARDNVSGYFSNLLGVVGLETATVVQTRTAIGHGPGRITYGLFFFGEFIDELWVHHGFQNKSYYSQRKFG